ncbi:hypothetical protein CGZ96_14645 [Enemella evansiae]|uniref:hypothetical protein n=1 Tax=Enemella evansiae TaxID=2016499 RepID=UPI000B95F21F|nr:hypothetical protein [Enemella evansiae]OYN95734.1 hypothetical protein CGZ96_14645 [Enemella evansiae]
MKKTPGPGAATEDSGVVIPADAEGRRSSSRLGREVTAAALDPVDPVGAAAALREVDWRNGYPVHARRLVEAGLGRTRDELAIAEAGLTAVRDRLRITTDSGEAPLAEALERPAARPLHTRTVHGTQAPAEEFSLPYAGRRLTGDKLLERLAAWERSGILEPSAADAVREVAAHPEWLALRGRRVVVLGASAEMGPLRALLSWGAEVVAVDLPRPELWQRLEKLARSSAGVLMLPEQQDGPGADLLQDLPAVADWLGGLDGPLVLGNYVYADGAVNLRLSAATDLLATRLTGARDDVALAWLATPTDVFAVPPEVVEASAEAYDHRGLRAFRPLIKGVSGGRLLKRNHRPGTSPGIADAMIPQQGPNYILAKRLHRWRAAVARRDGVEVSLRVAPPTKTRSVTRNRALAAAYAGAHHFGIEVFDPATSNTLMAALLVHDLNTGGSALPATAAPWQHEAEKAVHGGLWRGAYDPRSALGLALVLGWGAVRG